MLQCNQRCAHVRDDPGPLLVLDTHVSQWHGVSAKEKYGWCARTLAISEAHQHGAA